MYGYYDRHDQRTRAAKAALFGAAATAGIAGVLFRRELPALFEKGFSRAAENATVRETVGATVEYGLRGLDSFQSFLKGRLENNARFAGHFQDQGYSARTDYAEYSESRRAVAEARHLGKSADTLREKLGAADGPYGWSPEKIEALLSQSGIVKNYVSGDSMDVAETKGLIQRGGAFRDHLVKESQGSSFEEVMDRTVKDLQLVRANLEKRPKFDPLDNEDPLSAKLRELYAARLSRESSEGETALGKLLGARKARLGDSPEGDFESDRLIGEFGGDADSYKKLRQDGANARFVGRDGKVHDYSALRSLALGAKDYLSDRVQIPLAPFQTGISLGQLFPFASRAGDRPLAGVHNLGLRLGEDVQVFFEDRILKDSADGGVSVSAERYDVRTLNKSHAKHLVDAQNASRGQEGPSGDLFARVFGTAKDFLGGLGDIEPGTTPYWDKVQGFVRKFNSPHYVPNILRRAAKHALESEEDVLALSSVLGESKRRITTQDISDLLSTVANQEIAPGVRLMPDTARRADDDLLQLHPAVQGALDAVLGSSEASDAGRYADAFVPLSKFYRTGRGFSPKARKMFRDMEVMNRGDRRRYLSRTASYEDSRKAETLFGLDVKGSERLANVDILRGEIFHDILKVSASAARPESDAYTFEWHARRFAENGNAHASFVTQSELFARRLAGDSSGAPGAGSVDRINSYLAGGNQQALRDHLEKESRKRYSFLHVQPKEPASRKDFTERDRTVLIRKGQDPSRDGFLGWKRIYRAYASPSSVEDGDATHGSLFAYWLADRLHTAFQEIGLGLSAKHKASPASLVGGLIFARYLPIFVGLPEAHKLFNRITRDVPGLKILNPDTHRANVIDAIGRMTHKGRFRRRLLDLAPGLDFYLDDRSQEEENRSQRGSGYSPVRKGRWWSFGSREAFFGDHVSYYAPGTARIARSDWQAASNVQRNNWRYWRHFGGYLNPMNWGKGAYWQEEAMAKDRPYLKSGPAFDPDHPWNAPLNALFGRFLKPQKIYHPEYLPRRLGGTLENQFTGERPTSPFYGILHGGKGGRGPSGAGNGQGSGGYQDPRLEKGWTLHLPRPKRIRDASGDPLLDRINLFRAITGRNRLTPGNEGGVSPEEQAYIRSLGLNSGFERSAYHLQEIAGLYGWGAGLLLPGIQTPKGGVEVADASRGYGRERRFYDQEIGGLGGNIADVLRRFLPHRRRSIKQYDPAPNNMPSWLPGQEYMQDFKHGDPYTKVNLGELRLPGDSYERTHPGTRERMLRMRASSLGKTKEDMVAYLVKKEGDGRTSKAAEEGTKIHRILQERWRRLGIMEADEVEVYNKELDVTGHIDAILRLPARNGQFQRVIVDIKTKTAERFDAVKRSGKPEDENLDQLLFYMKTTGIKRGLLTYVNRENNDVYQLPVKWNQKRFDASVRRLSEARAEVLRRIKTGEVKRGDLYDPITKYEILADTAPYSAQFSEMQLWAARQKDSLSVKDQGRLRDTQKRVHRQKEGFELHPYRFRNAPLTLETVRIAKFTGRDGFESEGGQKYRLAGVSEGETKTALPTEDWWKTHAGLSVGDRVRVEFEPGSERKTVKAAVYSRGRNVGRALLFSGALEENREDYGVPSQRTRFTGRERTAGRIFEWLAHQNNPLTTKFLPARSGLEQYERTDVYGKKSGSWDHPLGSYLWPTLASFFNKNPVAAAAMGGMFGSLFFPFFEDKLISTKAGAVVGAALSVAGMAFRAAGKPFIPRAVKRRREIDQYYDTLTYVKYRRLAAQEEEIARTREHIDVSELENGVGNVTKENKEYMAGLRDTKESLLRKKKLLQRRLDRIRERRPAQAKRLRYEMRGLQEQAEEAGQEAKETGQEKYPVGPHALQALLYRQRYRATVHGGLDSGSWEAALSALPKNTRTAVVDVIQHGSKQEKRRMFALLPTDQKALFGYALDAPEKDIPDPPKLATYFRTHALPQHDWAGWQADASLDLIKARDVAGRSGLDPMDFGIFPQTVTEAQDGSPEALIPLPRRAGKRNIDHVGIKQEIHDLVSGYGLSAVRVSVDGDYGSDGDGHQADVAVNVRQHRENAFFKAFKKLLEIL